MCEPRNILAEASLGTGTLDLRLCSLGVCRPQQQLPEEAPTNWVTLGKCRVQRELGQEQLTLDRIGV